MLKIKYWGPFFDASGYGACSRQYIKTLVDCGANITLSPVSFERARPDLGDLGKYLIPRINKKINYKINLIHLTPEHYPLYKEKGKINVGYTVWETNKIHHDWIDYCNCMDALIVACDWNIDVFRDSGVTVPIYCVPHVVDVAVFDGVKAFKVSGPKEDDYVFYSIAQFTDRKDLTSLLKAYWYAFDSTDSVSLVIKTHRDNYSDGEKNAIIQAIKNLKEGMVLPKGKYHAPVHLILDLLSDDEIYGLHKTGDCFVSLNRGEGFGIPEAQAASTKNPVIVTGYGGVNQFLNKDNSYLVDYTLSPVSGMQPGTWYTSDQCWAQADVYGAARHMQYVYNNRKLAAEKGLLAYENIKDNFNYKTIGKLYMSILEKILLENK